MAEPTLKDVIERLRAEGQLTRNTGTNSIKSVKETFVKTSNEQIGVIRSLVDLQETEIQRQIRKDELGRAEKTRVDGTVSSTAKGEVSVSSSGGRTDQSGILSRLLGGMGVGAGLGALTSSIGRGAGGIAMLGLALPAFFGGLMAGDTGLGWLSVFGSGFNFDNLRAAAIGFTDIITELDQDALLALAGIMGISAFGGTRSALGLGSMGLAITGFFGGLLAGDALFAGASALGADLNFSALRNIATGFSDMILSLGEETFVVLAGIMGISAVGGRRAAEGLGMMGLAITSFFGGLLAGDALFAGANALGADLDLSSMRSVIRGFSEIIHELTPEAALALAGIMGGSGLLTAFSRGAGWRAALDYAAIMTGIGAGISGLMIGLVAGDAAMSWVQDVSGSDGSGLRGAFRMFNDSIGELNNRNAIAALTAIVGIGGGIGAIVGAISPGAAAGAGLGIFAIMTGIGAGISGLMLGLAAGGAGIELMQNFTGSDGSGITSMFRVFNDSILAITPEAIERLEMLSGMGFTGLAGTLGGLAAGMVALFGAEGLTTLGQIAIDAITAPIDWLFGTDYGEQSRTSVIQQLVDGLEPLKDLDMSLIDKMDDFGSAIERFGSSFASLETVNSDRGARNLTRMITDVGSVLNMMDALMEGRVYDTGTGPAIRLFGNTRGLIDFSPGLNNIDFGQLESMASAINAIRNAVGGNLETTAPSGETQGILGAMNFGSESVTNLYFGEGSEINIHGIENTIPRVIEMILSEMNSIALQQPTAAPIIITNAPTVAPVNNNIRGATNVSNQNISGVGMSDTSGLGRFAN